MISSWKVCETQQDLHSVCLASRNNPDVEDIVEFSGFVDHDLKSVLASSSLSYSKRSRPLQHLQHRRTNPKTKEADGIAAFNNNSCLNFKPEIYLFVGN